METWNRAIINVISNTCTSGRACCLLGDGCSSNNVSVTHRNINFHSTGVETHTER